MKTLEKIEKLIENLKSVKGLTFKTLNVVKQDLSISETKLPTEFNDEISQFSNLEFFWSLNLSNSKISALNLGADMTFGEVKIHSIQIEEGVKGFYEDPEDIFIDLMSELNIEDKFLVVDNLYPSHLIGYLIEDGKINDNLYLMTAFDDNLYDLSIGIKEYIHYGISCGFFNRWQMIFIKSTTYDEKVKKLGYYVSQILPKDIHEPFMQKFKERFGEIEYKPEDYR